MHVCIGFCTRFCEHKRTNGNAAFHTRTPHRSPSAAARHRRIRFPKNSMSLAPPPPIAIVTTTDDPHCNRCTLFTFNVRVRLMREHHNTAVQSKKKKCGHKNQKKDRTEKILLCAFCDTNGRPPLPTRNVREKKCRPTRLSPSENGSNNDRVRYKSGHNGDRFSLKITKKHSVIRKFGQHWFCRRPCASRPP